MAKKQFKTESKRILDMMINSVYTHKEIFLRELISNASDAIDKLAYRSLTDDSVKTAREDFKIEVKPDRDARTLTISDNGIGMSADELESNLGVIARSGSYAFKNELTDQEKEDKTVEIIGQFGVGFYSAFMVAEKVRVVSRKFGEDTANVWESTGADGYTVAPAERAAAGTDVILYIKPDTEDEHYSDYLDTYELKRIIKKYSDYIRFPIVMDVEKSRPVESDEVDEDGKKKTTYETYTEAETVNSMVPIWQRPKSEVSDEDCCAFYKEKYYDSEMPLKVIRIEAEGLISFKAMLFIPATVPYGYYTKDFEKGLQLYSNGVMIIDKCAELLPEHFRFVKGVVDSQDLSLNISREMLQHDRQLKFIAANLEKRIKTELKKLLENEREKYEKFYGAFGRNLKYGLVADYGAHKDLLADLLLFWSSKESKLVTLQEYADGMPEEQKYVYYAAGESRERLAQLPQLDALKEKGYDVLFFTEDVDEFIPQTLQKFADKEFRSVTADDLGLTTDEEKKAIEEKKEAAKPTLDFVKETLGERVKEVRLSPSLKNHPCCLTPEAGLSFEMEKYFQRMNPEMGLKAGRILEFNPEHPAFAALQVAVAQDPEKAKKYAEILYGQALLMADLPLDNPTEYTDLVCSMLV